jgi:REP element-mobilizing transposase RayT
MVRKLTKLPRRRIGRLPYWCYSLRQAYFITIGTISRYRYFGGIVGKEMILSEAGIIARNIWLEIPQHFSFITLDAFVFMPDHMHGVLIINRYIKVKHDRQEGAGGITGIHNPMLHDNISRVIRWYKGRTTYEIRKKLEEFKWHGRFYDRILRDDELYAFRNYIRNNPAEWERNYGCD